MNVSKVFGAVMVGVLLAAGAAQAQQKLVVCGTGDSQDVLRQLGAAFEKANPGKTIEVPDSIGSTGGIEATAKGECGLGRVARQLKEKEKALGLSYAVFAFSPVVFVADSAAGVEGLTRQQVLDVFSGTATSWTAVG
ncbi:MAG TPA: substrate-binding domain-containing protein, partial [Phycisphaerae bacterium]|nr:substrate-binding domain-containing protein [Phycisphaerae bacterium]